MIQNLQQSPAGLALENRAELELRPEQIEALEELNRSWLEANKPHLDVVKQLAEQAQTQAQGGRMGSGGGGGAMPQQGRPGMRGQGQGGGGQEGPARMAGAQEAVQALMQSRQYQLTTLGDILSANQLRELRQRIGPAGPGGAQAQRLQRMDRTHRMDRREGMRGR